jgi:cholesterol transport system auxiliary component
MKTTGWGIRDRQRAFATRLPFARTAFVCQWLAMSAAVLLLAGCSSILGGSKTPTTIYAPVARAQAPADWPAVQWSLALGRSYGGRGADGLRIAVRPTPNELQVYKGAQWSRPPNEMLEEGILQTLEDSGRIATVARQGSGIGADYRLLLDVRRFEADYAGNSVPSATIEVTAKLLHVKTQQLAGSRTFLQARPASTTAVPDVVAAFEQALTTTSREIAGWTLAIGEQHARQR